MTTERLDVLAQLRTTYCPPKCLAAVADLIEHAETVAHYNKFTAPTDEYVEIPRATVDKLVAALARVGWP